MNHDYYYSFPNAVCVICNSDFASHNNEKTCSKRCEFISLDESEKNHWIEKERENYQHEKQKQNQNKEILEHTKKNFTSLIIELTEDQIREIIIQDGTTKNLNQQSITIDLQEVKLRQLIGVTTNHHYPEVVEKTSQRIKGLDFTWRRPDNPFTIDQVIYFGGSRKDLFEWYTDPDSFIHHIDGMTIETDGMEGLTTIVQAKLLVN